MYFEDDFRDKDDDEFKVIAAKTNPQYFFWRNMGSSGGAKCLKRTGVLLLVVAVAGIALLGLILLDSLTLATSDTSTESSILGPSLIAIAVCSGIGLPVLLTASHLEGPRSTDE